MRRSRSVLPASKNQSSRMWRSRCRREPGWASSEQARQASPRWRVRSSCMDPSPRHLRLDAAALDQFDEEALGRDVGYLPQDIELFEGTVAENINRFNANARRGCGCCGGRSCRGQTDDPPAERRFPDAYRRRRLSTLRRPAPDGRSGEGIVWRSVPRRSRRANSNLDGEGDIALGAAIKGVRDRGGIVVVIAHRPAALANIDTVLVMAGGTVQAMGPRDEVLAKMTRPANVRPEQAPGGERAPTVVTLHDRRP